MYLVSTILDSLYMEYFVTAESSARQLWLHLCWVYWRWGAVGRFVMGFGDTFIVYWRNYSFVWIKAGIWLSDWSNWEDGSDGREQVRHRGQKSVLVMLCHLYEIRVKVSLNRAGEEKGKLILWAFCSNILSKSLMFVSLIASVLRRSSWLVVLLHITLCCCRIEFHTKIFVYLNCVWIMILDANWKWLENEESSLFKS